MTALLSGTRVLDVSDPTGAACASFLASLGAEVIRIEQPVSNGGNDSPAAIMARRGKKAITLDPETREGAGLFKQLVTHCDFLVETFTPGYLAQQHLDYHNLAAINPRLIQVSITPFGQSGPLAHYKGGELVASAMGGTLATCGYPDDTPVLEALDACCYHASAAAAMGALFAHRERGLSGQGQHIDCAIQEVAASRNTNNLLSWQFDQRKLPRAGNKIQFGVARVRVVWALADGYCFHSLMTGKFGAPANTALSRWMSEEGFDNPMADVDWDKYDRSALPADTRLEWEAAMARFFKSKTKHDINTEGRRRGIRATVANDPQDVLQEEHLQARDFLKPVTLPDGSDLKVPDYFVRLSNSEFRSSHRIPATGESNAAVYGQLLGVDDGTLAQYKTEGVI